ncbi:MAG: TIGR02452 family protein [Clostridiales bacterium]|nr:TIGR02452 family protein [Clostridiales bacterium]
MAEQETNKALSEEERLKQMAAQMRAREYQGLSEEEIQERERQKEMRKKKNIAILEETLSILEQGGYAKDGRDVHLTFSPEQLREIQVYLPEELTALTVTEREESQVQSAASCTFACENEDALVLAQKQYQALKNAGESAPQILVLNLASATRPGGRTRDGASAQEEDLCRRTSLLLSLESEDAKRYYDYNNARKTRMGSDGVMLSPNVEVVKDASSEPLSEPFPISVMSCAAPMVRLGLEGMSQQEYEEMLYRCIGGMLLVAASQGYRHLILGAFGCGVYGNDAALVSDLFARVIRDFTFAGENSGKLFDSIQFAVLCRPGKDYNYREFCRNFSTD